MQAHSRLMTLKRALLSAAQPLTARVAISRMANRAGMAQTEHCDRRQAVMTA